MSILKPSFFTSPSSTSPQQRIEQTVVEPFASLRLTLALRRKFGQLQGMTCQVAGEF